MTYDYHNIYRACLSEGRMNTKLTLRLDKPLIEAAKQYSSDTGESISKIVGDLFSMIARKKNYREYEISPTVRVLKGILKKGTVSERGYKRYLRKKYL